MYDVQSSGALTRERERAYVRMFRRVCVWVRACTGYLGVCFSCRLQGVFYYTLGMRLCCEKQVLKPGSQASHPNPTPLQCCFAYMSRCACTCMCASCLLNSPNAELIHLFAFFLKKCSRPKLKKKRGWQWFVVYFFIIVLSFYQRLFAK